MIEEARTSLLNLQEATGLGHPTPSQVSGMVGLGTRAVDLPLGGSDTVHRGTIGAPAPASNVAKGSEGGSSLAGRPLPPGGMRPGLPGQVPVRPATAASASSPPGGTDTTYPSERTVQLMRVPEAVGDGLATLANVAWNSTPASDSLAGTQDQPAMPACHTQGLFSLAAAPDGVASGGMSAHATAVFSDTAERASYATLPSTSRYEPVRADVGGVGHANATVRTCTTGGGVNPSLVTGGIGG